jgi:hypothetical protein
MLMAHLLHHPSPLHLTKHFQTWKFDYKKKTIKPTNVLLIIVFYYHRFWDSSYPNYNAFSDIEFCGGQSVARIIIVVIVIIIIVSKY